MPVSWDSVASNPDYMALAPDQQAAARSQYFQQIVAPNVPPDQLTAAQQQFEAYSGGKAAPAKIGVGEDMLKSAAGGLERGVAALPMILPNTLNQAVAGPQMLYRGLTGGEHDNSPLYQPFYSSEDVLQALPDALKPHTPQTAAGVGVDLASQLSGNLLAGKAAPVVANGVGDLLADNTSGVVRPQAQPQALPAGMQDLSVLPDAAKQAGMLPKKVNALEVGLDANKSISQQYEVDTGLQRQLYGDLNQKGAVMSIKAPELYSKLDDMIGYLKDKVAVDTPEYRAYTELKEYRDNLDTKYGIQGTPDKTAQLPSWKQPMVVEKGTPAQDAYGIEPSDLVDLKTAINTGLKPNNFSNAGSMKILSFKKYVQNGLDEASSISPEFGTALKAAEAQAKKVSIYKSPELKPLWQPQDYVAYKGNGDLPAATQSRAAKFLDNLNTQKVGRASTLAKILPKDQATTVLKHAINNARSQTPNVAGAAAQAISGHPIAAVKTVASSIVNPKKIPLQDLAKQIRGMQYP